MKQLIEYIAKSLVEKPEAVVVQEKSTDGGMVIELKVDNDDLGRIIGKQGKTVKSMRQLLTAAATKAKLKVSLIVQE